MRELGSSDLEPVAEHSADECIAQVQKVLAVLKLEHAKSSAGAWILAELPDKIRAAEAKQPGRGSRVAANTVAERVTQWAYREGDLFWHRILGASVPRRPAPPGQWTGLLRNEFWTQPIHDVVRDKDWGELVRTRFWEIGTWSSEEFCDWMNSVIVRRTDPFGNGRGRAWIK